MRLRLLFLASIVTVAAACGGSQEIPVKPTLFIDRTKLGFGQEDNSGTYIGATGYDSILLRNDGQDELDLTSVTLTGDDGKFTQVGPDKTTLKYQDTASIEIDFEPSKPKVYSGTLVIASNAANTPSVTVTLSGCGVTPVTPPADPDLSYCLNSDDF
jgi:hypothetical protein